MFGLVLLGVLLSLGWGGRGRWLLEREMYGEGCLIEVVVEGGGRYYFMVI